MSLTENGLDYVMLCDCSRRKMCQVIYTVLIRFLADRTNGRAYEHLLFTMNGRQKTKQIVQCTT